MVNIFVEEIPPIYLCCDALISAEDIASAMRFQNEKRRTEHLAWRRIIRRELGASVSISYNEVGAPIVNTPDTFISVAHSKEMVAVAISDRAIGIDIESSKRDFERAKSRYMDEEELALCDSTLWGAYVWTAKEAMYKLGGLRGIDLRGDLRIESFDPQTLTMRGTIASIPNKMLIEISHKEDDTVVAVASYE